MSSYFILRACFNGKPLKHDQGFHITDLQSRQEKVSDANLSDCGEMLFGDDTPRALSVQDQRDLDASTSQQIALDPENYIKKEPEQNGDQMQNLTYTQIDTETWRDLQNQEKQDVISSHAIELTCVANSPNFRGAHNEFFQMTNPEGSSAPLIFHQQAKQSSNSEIYTSQMREELQCESKMPKSSDRDELLIFSTALCTQELYQKIMYILTEGLEGFERSKWVSFDIEEEGDKEMQDESFQRFIGQRPANLSLEQFQSDWQILAIYQRLIAAFKCGDNNHSPPGSPPQTTKSAQSSLFKEQFQINQMPCPGGGGAQDKPMANKEPVTQNAGGGDNEMPFANQGHPLEWPVNTNDGNSRQICQAGPQNPPVQATLGGIDSPQLRSPRNTEGNHQGDSQISDSPLELPPPQTANSSSSDNNARMQGVKRTATKDLEEEKVAQPQDGHQIQNSLEYQIYRQQDNIQGQRGDPQKPALLGKRQSAQNYLDSTLDKMPLANARRFCQPSGSNQGAIKTNAQQQERGKNSHVPPFNNSLEEIKEDQSSRHRKPKTQGQAVPSVISQPPNVHSKAQAQNRLQEQNQKGNDSQEAESTGQEQGRTTEPTKKSKMTTQQRDEYKQYVTEKGQEAIIQVQKAAKSISRFNNVKEADDAISKPFSKKITGSVMRLLRNLNRKFNKLDKEYRDLYEQLVNTNDIGLLNASDTLEQISGDFCNLPNLQGFFETPDHRRIFVNVVELLLTIPCDHGRELKEDTIESVKDKHDKQIAKIQQLHLYCLRKGFV